MAIIDTRGGSGFEPLLQVLLNEKQLAQEKERIKLSQQQFKLQQEQWMAQQGQQKGLEEAAMLMLERLGQNQGVDPSAAPALVQQLQQERQLALVDQQTALAAEELRQAKDLFGLRQRQLEAQAARDEAAVETDRRRLDQEARFFETQIRQTAQEAAIAEIRNFSEFAQAFGNPALASRIFFGTDAPPTIGALTDERLASLEGAKSAEDAISQRLTRTAGVLGLPETAVSELRRAFQATPDPQQVVNAIFSQADLDDASKAQLFAAVQSAFPDRALTPPPEQLGTFRRFWNAFKFEAGQAFRNARPPGPRPGVRQSPTGA